MPATMDTVLQFWNDILENDDAKPADRIKVSENLAKYLDTRSEAPEAPRHIVIDYLGTPESAARSPP